MRTEVVGSPGETYVVTASKEGYRSASQTVTAPADGEEVEMHLRLIPEGAGPRWLESLALVSLVGLFAFLIAAMVLSRRSPT